MCFVSGPYNGRLLRERDYHTSIIFIRVSSRVDTRITVRSMPVYLFFFLRGLLGRAVSSTDFLRLLGIQSANLAGRCTVYGRPYTHKWHCIFAFAVEWVLHFLVYNSIAISYKSKLSPFQSDYFRLLHFVSFSAIAASLLLTFCLFHLQQFYFAAVTQTERNNQFSQFRAMLFGTTDVYFLQAFSVYILLALFLFCS